MILKNNQTEMLKNLVKRIIIAYSLILLSWLGFVVAGGVVAFFSDLEKSADNVLAAGVLKMDVTGDGIDFENFKYRDIASTTLVVADVGDTAFWHGFEIFGTGDLCEYLSLTASYSGTINWEMKDVALVDFSTGYDFSAGTWNINVYLPKKNKTKTGYCSFEFAFHATQEGDEEGYWDKASVENWIGTGEKDDFTMKIQAPSMLKTEIVTPEEPITALSEEEKSPIIEEDFTIEEKTEDNNESMPEQAMSEEKENEPEAVVPEEIGLPVENDSENPGVDGEDPGKEEDENQDEVQPADPEPDATTSETPEAEPDVTTIQETETQSE